MRDAEFRIALGKKLMGTHLTRWTLTGMVSSDIFDRALPWDRMAFARGSFTTQLNTSYGQPLAVACACLGLVFLAISPLSAWALLAAVMFFAVAILVDVPLFQFFIRE